MLSLGQEGKPTCDAGSAERVFEIEDGRLRGYSLVKGQFKNIVLMNLEST